MTIDQKLDEALNTRDLEMMQEVIDSNIYDLESVNHFKQVLNKWQKEDWQVESSLGN